MKTTSTDTVLSRVNLACIDLSVQEDLWWAKWLAFKDWAHCSRSLLWAGITSVHRRGSAVSEISVRTSLQRSQLMSSGLNLRFKE